MSLILEALRRADKERKTGSPPDVGALVGAPSRPSSRPVWPWLLVATATLAGLLVAVYWINGTGVPPVTAETVGSAAPVPAPSPTGTNRPSGPAARPVPAPEDPVAPGFPTARTSTRREVPERVRKRAESMRRASAAAPASVPVEPEEPAVREGPAPTPQPFGSASVPGPEEAPAPETPEGTPSVSDSDTPAAEPSPVTPPSGPAPDPTTAPVRPSQPPGATGASVQPAEASTAAVPVENLPAGQRAAFQAVSLNAHVYAEKPSKRFVLIDMRIHRIGDVVGDTGLVVEDITSEGAVLRSGDTRAFLPHP